MSGQTSPVAGRSSNPFSEGLKRSPSISSQSQSPMAKVSKADGFDKKSINTDYQRGYDDCNWNNESVRKAVLKDNYQPAYKTAPLRALAFMAKYGIAMAVGAVGAGVGIGFLTHTITNPYVLAVMIGVGAVAGLVALVSAVALVTSFLVKKGYTDLNKAKKQDAVNESTALQAKKKAEMEAAGVYAPQAAESVSSDTQEYQAD